MIIVNPSSTYRNLAHLTGWLLLALILLLPATPSKAGGPSLPLPPEAEAPPAGLTAADWQQITAQIEQHQYAPVTTPQTDSLRAINTAQGWSLTFTPTGLTVQPTVGNWWWSLHLQAYGRAGAMLPLQPADLSAEGQTITYQWSDTLRELYHNRPGGLKQDFILERRPNGSGRLRLEIAILGNLTSQLANGSLNFYDTHNQLILTYASLRVYDAAGQEVPAWFELAHPATAPLSPMVNRQSEIVTIVVDDATARYPLTIDPLAQQAYLKASNTGGDAFGRAVAVSGDTVVVGAFVEDSNATGVNGNGANNDVTDAGAAYVFIRSAGVWSQQAYLKASNPGAGDQFGISVAVSGDTVVVGAHFEDSNATGINGDGANNAASNAGAAYVFTRSGSTWSQQAYLKASNTGAEDRFGVSVAVSGDTVVVGAHLEFSNATGVNGDQADNSFPGAGAAYIFTRSGSTWSQQAYLKASNTGGDQFGISVAISGDTVVVGAYLEASNATGVNGDQADNSALGAGAVYVFTRSGSTWSQQAYLKASNTGAGDQFGYPVAVSGDTVVVGASGEDSNATGINGDGTNNAATDAGAAYVFTRSGSTWSQQAYLKASNTEWFDAFGISIAVSGDTVVVGAHFEDSNATGINGDGTNNAATDAGAAYVFTRSGSTWSQQAYLKASNTEWFDAFGISIAISGDMVAVGAYGEASNTTGVNGNQADNSILSAGAAYTFFVFSKAVYLPLIFKSK